jgi:DNA modification methylase
MSMRKTLVSPNRQSQIAPLAIVYRELAKLVADPNNPRLHSDKQIQQIARSIKTFGFSVPVLIDRKLKLIAGHGRLAACKLLGITEIPTIMLDHLSEHQAQALMLADNRLTENASWDDRLLAEQLKALSEVNLDFSLESTGFEIAEIDLLIEGLVSPTEAQRDDQLPSPSDVIVTRTGDLWLLGRNRLFCGNALQEDSYQLVMGRQRAVGVFTDPPYNVQVDGYVTGFGKVHHAEFAMASGEMTPEEFRTFLARVFGHLTHFSRSGSIHYICMDWRHTKDVLGASEGIYQELKNICVWIKDGGGQGSHYRSQHEFVFVFKNGTGKHRNNIQLGQFGRYRTNCWSYPRVRSGTDKELTEKHPTVKPVALVADAIQDCTARNEIILDAFLGTGTTLIAAERTGRTCHAIELEPAYVDLAIRRWQTLTGMSAIHAGSGRSFNESGEALHG